MQLQSYMKENGLDDDAMAAAIGDCSASAVRKWKYGERIPRPPQARRIAEITNGRVTMNDFVGLGGDETGATPRDDEAAE